MDASIARAQVAEAMRFSHLWNLAGFLTGARLVAACAMPWLEPTAWLLPVYVLALVTDVLDGWVARRTGTASAAGAALDAWVDKILHVNLLWSLTLAGRLPVMWMPALFARELLQAPMIPLLVHRFRTLRGPPPAASWFGRGTTIGLACTTVSAIVGHPSQVLAGVTALLSVCAGLDYARVHRPDIVLRAATRTPSR
jgi:phosphatidylglycerophosphate synthase